MLNTTSKECLEKNKHGASCKSPPLADSDYCFWHDPRKVAERKAARSKGGKKRQGRVIGSIPPDDHPLPGLNRPTLERLDADSINAVLMYAINDTLRLETGISRARTLGALATVALRAIELTELERRIQQLEQQAALRAGAYEGAKNGQYQNAN